MNSLKEVLTERYASEKLEISIINQEELTVTLIGAGYKDYSPDEKQEIAREIGQLAVSIDEEQPKFKSGVVEFVENSRFLVVSISHKESYDMFPDHPVWQ